MLIFSFQYFSLQGGLGYTKKIDPFKTPVCIDIFPDQAIPTLTICMIKLFYS